MTLMPIGGNQWLLIMQLDRKEVSSHLGADLRTLPVTRREKAQLPRRCGQSMGSHLYKIL
eukprot:2326932-Amphidinium_carterae.1